MPGAILPDFDPATFDLRTSSGRQIVAAGARMGATARENLYADAILSGNSRLQWQTLPLVAPDGRRLELSVSTDYLSVGQNDPVRLPLYSKTAQRIADALGAILPTPRIVDAIWRAVGVVRVTPRSMTPRAGVNRDSATLLLEHENAVNATILAHGGYAPGVIVAGAKKDIVVGAAMRRNPGKVVIYGWHRPDGRPIQPPFAGHSDVYADYSHGVRLVKREARVNGVPVTIEQVFADAMLAPLVSADGVLSAASLRYPTG